MVGRIWIRDGPHSARGLRTTDLDYGHLTYSSVQCSLCRPVTLSKLTTTNRFSKKPLHWINWALHISKIKCSAGVFIWMYLWKEPTIFRKALMSFSFHRYRGNRFISCSNSASCWQRINLHLQSVGNTGVRQQTNKKHASEELIWEGV